MFLLFQEKTIISKSMVWWRKVSYSFLDDANVTWPPRWVSQPCTVGLCICKQLILRYDKHLYVIVILLW